MIKPKVHKSPRMVAQAEKALQSAIRKLIEERRRKGESIIVWKNGRVVRIPADKLGKKR